MTILEIYHGALLVTIADYLLDTILITLRTGINIT